MAMAGTGGARGWFALAAASAVASFVALVASVHYTPVVRLPGVRIQATLVIAAIAATACVASLLGARRPSLGFAGWSLVSASCAVFWLAIGKHSFSGPVVLELGRDHGIHLTDGLALVPLAGAALLAVHAWREAARPLRVGQRVGSG